jgi:hypothetical protein
MIIMLTKYDLHAMSDILNIQIIRDIDRHDHQSRDNNFVDDINQVVMSDTFISDYISIMSDHLFHFTNCRPDVSFTLI